MPDDEGLALHRLARERLPHGPALEVGGYCGKSAVYLGAAAQAVGGVVFSVDHHRGSEENQAGWEHHDTEVVDPRTGRMDTLPFFRRTIEDAGLEDVVVGMLGDSPTVGAHWHTPLGFLFIDGGHAEDVASADYAMWAHHVLPGGVLALLNAAHGKDHRCAFRGEDQGGLIADAAVAPCHNDALAVQVRDVVDCPHKFQFLIGEYRSGSLAQV